MKLSEKSRAALYRAISDPIMELRGEYYQCVTLSSVEVDGDMFTLEQEIWKRVKAALNLEAVKK